MTKRAPLPPHITKPLAIGIFGLVFVIGLFVIWAIYAPLSSTIHTTGSLDSERPSFELQHEYGGKIAEVHVRQHDLVGKGDEILRFDTDTLETSLDQVQNTIALLTSENAAIDALTHDDDPKAALSNSNASVQDKMRFSNRYETQLLEAKNLREESRAEFENARLIDAKLAHLKDRIETVTARADREKTLSQKGALAQRDQDRTSEELAGLLGTRADEEARLVQTLNAAETAKTNARLVGLRFRDQLLQQRAQNARAILDLTERQLQYRDQIEAAVLLAPISGSVVSLDFDTVDMYAPRGQTIAVLSNDIFDPRASILIPPSAIDQVSVGRKGKLTIPALPQRNLPNVYVSLSAISPDIEKSAEGEPLGYRALAEIDPEDLKKLQDSLDGQLILANSMPISVAIEGRSMTFAQYLITPFFKAFQGALVD